MASIQFFHWNGEELILNVPEILLVKEFKNLYDYGKEGDKDRSFDYFRFLWLMYNDQTPYRDRSEEVRLETSLDDCGFNAMDVEFPIMEMAILKYEFVINTALTLMLHSAKKAVDKVRLYFDALDLTETDEKGRLKYNASNVIKQFKELGQIHIGLSDLEKQVKEERDISKGIRGDNE